MSLWYNGTDADIRDTQKIRTFKASGAITAGDVVCIDATQTGIERVLQVKQGTNGTSTLAVGIARETVASGEPVEVVVHGYYEGANVASATTSGQFVKQSSSAGRADALVQADTAAWAQPVALALENASSNTCDVLVLNPLGF